MEHPLHGGHRTQGMGSRPCAERYAGRAPGGGTRNACVTTSSALIEANFLGLDPRIREPRETSVFEDPELPLMVSGPLGLLRPGPVIDG